MRIEREWRRFRRVRTGRAVSVWSFDTPPRWPQYPNKGYRARTEPHEPPQGWEGPRHEPPTDPWQPKISEPSGPSDPLALHPRKARSPLDEAYESLDKLLVTRHRHGSSPALETEMDAAWALLRELQEAQIRTAERTLEASFALPPSELERLTREARALLDADDGE